MTLYAIIEKLKMLALKHPNVNSAYEGNIYDIMNANPQQKYASVVLTQQSHTQDDTYDHYGFNIFYVDRLVDDLDSNRVQIQSTGKSMLSNIIKAFCEEFDAECDTINYQTFTERFADECAGVYCTITIDMVKDIYCTEKYWDESWATPLITVRNQNKSVEFTANGTYTIEYDATNYSGLGKVEVEVNVPDLNGSYDDGYSDGFNEGKQESYEEGKQDGYTEGFDVGKNQGLEEGYADGKADGIEEGYSQGKTDGFNEGKAEGYTEGKEDGISEQKAKLEGITITENGTYNREDGYNEIVVEVPDLNGSYDEGYDVGYSEGIEEGTSNAGAIIAETAQVLNITENGTYITKYSKPEDFGREITGYFDDGTPFYNYARLDEHYSKTDITLQPDSVVEIWVKPRGTTWSNWQTGDGIFAEKLNTNVQKFCIKINNKNDGQEIAATINGTTRTVKCDIEQKWYHFVLSESGLFIDGEKVTDSFDGAYIKDEYLYILGGDRNTESYCGMIKVTSNGVTYTIIPTENGLKNITTDTLLEVVREGTYKYTGLPEFEGNLARTVNVNIIPKINIQKEGITFSYYKLTEVPEWADWSNIQDMKRMFYYSEIKELPMIDTSNVTTMEYMCGYSDISTIPQFDTRNVISMREMFNGCSSLLSIPLLNTSNVTNFSNFTYGCSKLTSFPAIDTSNATNFSSMFGGCTSLTTIPPLNAGKVTNTGSFLGYSELKNLTNFGGLIGLKASMNDNYGFVKTPNLTYESCINILNGLYDFVGNSITPSAVQGKLKVHANFLTTVGDELSIGTNKGWTITA